MNDADLCEFERLLMAVATAGDERRYDEYVMQFAADGVLAVAGGPELHGRDAIREGLIAGAARRGAAEPGNFQRHNITTREFTPLPDGRVAGFVYLMVTTELGLDHAGHYRDVYRKIDGRWLIERRTATAEWMRPDSRFLRWIAPPSPQ